MSSYTGNLRLLQKAAKHGGFLNTTKAADGVIRSTPLVLAHDGMIYPALSLAMARRYMKSLRFKVETVRVDEGENVTGLLLDKTRIPTDKYGRVLVPYSGKRGTVPYVSATALLRSADPAGDFPPSLNCQSRRWPLLRCNTTSRS